MKKELLRLKNLPFPVSTDVDIPIFSLVNLLDLPDIDIMLLDLVAPLFAVSHPKPFRKRDDLLERSINLPQELGMTIWVNQMSFDPLNPQSWKQFQDPMIASEQPTSQKIRTLSCTKNLPSL